MYSNMGLELRISNIFDQRSGNCIIAAIDQGLFLGPVEGTADIKGLVWYLVKGNPDAIQLSPGSAYAARESFKGKDAPRLIIRLDTTNLWRRGPTSGVREGYHTPIISVDDGLKMGADACVCFYFIGHGDDTLESENVRLIGRWTSDCKEFGIPLLVETVPIMVEDENDPELLKLVVRVAAEAGADIVSTNFSGSERTFKEVVDACPVPILLRGGPKVETVREQLEMVEIAVKAGARGVVFGRDAFLAGATPKMIQVLARIVHEKQGVREALQLLESEA